MVSKIDKPLKVRTSVQINFVWCRGGRGGPYGRMKLNGIEGVNLQNLVSKPFHNLLKMAHKPLQFANGLGQFFQHHIHLGRAILFAHRQP